MRQLFTGVAALAVGLALAACADAPGTPLAPRDRIVAAAKGGNGRKQQPSGGDLLTMHDSLDRTQAKVAGTKWVTPLAAPVTASATIGAEGGWLEMPATGLSVYVPPGAVSVPTTFAATAAAGKLVAYDFEPAGSKFAVPLFIVLDRSFLATPSATDPLSITTGPQLGYFADDSALDQSTSSAIASELRTQLAVSSPDYTVFPVWHFSGYIVCWGRSSE